MIQKGILLPPEIQIVIPLLIQLSILAFVVMFDPYLRKEYRGVMLIIILVVFGFLIKDLIAYKLDLSGIMPYPRTLLAIWGYIMRPILIVLYLYIVNPHGKYVVAWILIGINAVVYLTAAFSDICFSIDENNEFHRGPLGYTVHIVGGILLIYTVWLMIRKYGEKRNKENIIPIISEILIVIAVIIDSVVDYRRYPVTFLTLIVTNINVFYYIWLHLQFVRAHEQALLAEQRIQIMMTQIQPHFLYNTLTVIQSLCRTNPEKAFDTIEKFGTYLRQNLDSLNQPDLIPLRKELEHTEIYTEIEMLRFPKIRIEYDIRDVDFKVPALTVQPLVENAVRHGVRIRKNGLITVSTKKENSYHEIVISDNGIGFDVKEVKNTDGGHIGIRNVMERIEKMCGGTLHIDSRPGEGTAVTIRIPLKVRE